MVDSSQAIDITMSYSELLEIVGALSDRVRKLVELSAPEFLINSTLSRAKKFNDILVRVGYDHYTPEYFEDIRKKVKS